MLSCSVLLLVLAIVLALVSRGRGEASPLRVAAGASGGAFHPVAGNFVPDGTKLADCRGDPRCLQQAFGNISYANGPRFALRLFDQRMRVDKTVLVDCHRIAHMIGSAALAHFRGNVAEAYSHGSATCASGYFHGILERAFVHVFTDRGLARVARSLCRGSGVRRWGFLDYHTGGAFMENGSTVYGLRSQWLRTSDPLYPCNWVKLRDRASCYLRVTTQVYRTNGADWRKTARTCETLERRWARFCFRSYGRDAVGSSRGEGADVILDRCRTAGDGEGDCLYGAARTLADANADPGPAASFCKRAPRAEQGSCFSGVGVVVGLLNATNVERATACARLTHAYARECANAARAEVAPNGRGAWG
ncbi:MAG: hypothetical protein E6G64_01400 [Actinobacteria bacterium]|nr:MAG: hypothetical protein E6G64_01400 [Actinomycetota bacterium]